MMLPCGQCIGCRLERSRQWAIRCHHEASLYRRNCFITLTFNNENLPRNLSVDVRDYQLFMKRLRKEYGAGIRFFHCGEYGEKFGRPHYHACLFNFDFPDKKHWKTTKDTPLYTSSKLQELWPFGYCSIGAVTFNSAAYVARYITKKITGQKAEEHYTWIDPETGEIHQRKPEYITMSRKPGIGREWLRKFQTDVYPDDFLIINGSKIKPPKYYDSQYEIEYPDDYKQVRLQRSKSAKHKADDNTPDRLKVREKVQQSKMRALSRSLEKEI